MSFHKSCFEQDIRHKVREVFNSCDNCGKKLSEIEIDVYDRESIKKQRNTIRLCRKCAKKSKEIDDVITLELKKAGII